MNIVTIPMLAMFAAAAQASGTDPLAKAAETTASGGFPWKGAVLAAAVVGAVAASVRAVRKDSKEFAKSAKDELLDDVLNAVAKDAPDREALRSELSAAVDGAGTLRSAPLASILRIEESYEKNTSGKYLRRVSVLRRKADDSGGSLAKVESEVSWEYVPDAIRARFIESREDKVVRRVYDAGKDGKA